MSKLSVGKYKKRLLEEREVLRRELEALDRDISGDDSAEAQSELADYDNHPADAASETFERTKDIALRDSRKALLGKVDEALAKIERGTYGECDRCGADIGNARLDAVPYALYCVKCQDEIEGR